MFGSYWTGDTPSDPATLANHYLYLGSVCNTTLSWQGRANPNTSAALKSWADTAVAQKLAHKKVVLRPRYDSSSAGNLVQNAGFDGSDVSSFHPLDSQIQVSRSTLDAASCSSSGSLLVTNNAPNGLNSGALQCINGITPGTTLNVGGNILVPSGGAQGQAFLMFSFTSGANCTVSILQNVLLSGPSTFDTWQPVSQDGVVVPAGAAALEVYASVVKNFPNQLPYRANYDGLYATPAPGHF